MQRTDPEANKIVRDLWKRHLALDAMDNTPLYWDGRAKFKDELSKAITSYLCAAVTADNLLKLAAMQGKYRPMQPVYFVVALSTAHDHLEENRAMDRKS